MRVKAISESSMKDIGRDGEEKEREGEGNIEKRKGRKRKREREGEEKGRREKKGGCLPVHSGSIHPFLNGQ